MIGYSMFLNQTTYSTGTGTSPRSVTVVDVNSDNKPDIVVANEYSANVGVLLNTGTGTFLSQTTYSTGTYPYSVAVVDVNSDKNSILLSQTSVRTTSVFFSTQAMVLFLLKLLTQLAVVPAQSQ
jgi:hypothetical protein